MDRARVREAAVDIGPAVVVAIVVGTAIAADLGGSSPPPAVAVTVPLAFGALVLARRRFPVLTLLATAIGLVAHHVADLPPIGVAVPLAAALYSAAEAGRVRWAAGTAAALLAISTAARLREGDDAAYLLGFELASTAALMVAVIALGDGVRSRRLLRAEQRRREEQAARDREREAARRVQEERVRIARDLHDVLAHTVAVISLQAAVATEALPGEPAAAGAALEVIRAAGAEAMAELRGTLGVLREGEAGRAPVGGVAQLDRLARGTTGSGLPVTVRVEGDPVALPVAVDATAYRIVQESLTNALRHAGARRAEVRLRYGRDLRITVLDDGCGATGDPAGGPGQGLRGMRERAALLGGVVVVGPGDGGGFRVDATLPLSWGSLSPGSLSPGSRPSVSLLPGVP